MGEGEIWRRGLGKQSVATVAILCVFDVVKNEGGNIFEKNRKYKTF